MSPALQADSLPAEPQGKPKNTGLGSLLLLQQIFLTQELNQGLLHCRWVLYQLSYEESPTTTEEERREKKRKKYKRIYRTNRKVRTINVFLLFSLDRGHKPWVPTDFLSVMRVGKPLASFCDGGWHHQTYSLTVILRSWQPIHSFLALIGLRFIPTCGSCKDAFSLQLGIATLSIAWT